jgi:CRP-like cAMP-binding protein
MSEFSNQFLTALSDTDLDLLRPDLEPIDLPVKFAIEKPRTKIHYIYFLETGLVSTVSGNSGRPVEIGLIGKEGLTGLNVVLGDDQSTHDVYMQAAGHGYRMKARELRAAIDKSPTLQAMLLKYVQVFMLQASHTAVANGRSKIEERLARWLLMAHDRLDTAILPLTHEFLATMLGVRRAGVTDAIHALEGGGFIKAAERGLIRILDREGLVEHANGCYGVPEQEYRRLFGKSMETAK